VRQSGRVVDRPRHQALLGVGVKNGNEINSCNIPASKVVGPWGDGMGLSCRPRPGRPVEGHPSPNPRMDETRANESREDGREEDPTRRDPVCVSYVPEVGIRLAMIGCDGTCLDDGLVGTRWFDDDGWE
jgi:hypothetical protein